MTAPDTRTDADRIASNLAAQERLGAIIADRDIDRLGEVFADDVVDHDPAPDQPAGAEGVKSFWRTFLAAFPDAELEPVVTAATPEHVTIVIDVTGTHRGEFQGVAPTGRRIRVRGIQVARFADGRIVERWGSTDTAGILQQLGAA